MNNAKLTYDDIQKSIKSIVNECYDISENKFPILKSIKKIEIDNYKSFDELRIVMFNHALKYDCELQETFLLKLNELFSNSDFKFENLSDEAREKCKSSKWGNKKNSKKSDDYYKFTPYFISDCKINMFIQKKAYEDFNIIYRNINKVILNTYSYCVISDFTAFFILVYKYEINPININIAVDSEFEKWLYELFGAKSENIDLIDNWDGKMEELNYKGPIAKIKDDNGNKKLIPAKYANKPKKYDITFGNPPYGTSDANSLDLNILKHMFSFSKNVIFIHPSDWFLKLKCNRPIKAELKKSKFLKEISLFWGNEMFGIGLFVPLCISYWDTEKNDDTVIVNDMVYSKKKLNCKGNEFTIHYGNTLNFINEFEDFKNFVLTLNENESVWSYRVKSDYSDMTDFSIRMPILQGGMYFLANNPKKEFKCKKNARASRSRDDERRFWSFKTEYERENFINYFKTKIVRFILSFLKTDQNMGPDNYRMIPWLDFTQEWNDAKLCKEFGISEELWKYIDNFIPDYYDDYKSGFEK